jgi:hypothetical protein
MTLATSRRRPGKLKADRIGLRGTAMSPQERLRPEVGRVVLRSVVRAENHGLRTGIHAENSPKPAISRFLLLPPASPAFGSGTGKQKNARRASFNRLIPLRKFGAGEGIRTLDPNLGKVVFDSDAIRERPRKVSLSSQC